MPNPAIHITNNSPTSRSSGIIFHGHTRTPEDIEKYLRTSSEPYDHPDIRRAFQLKLDWEARRKLASNG